MRHRWVGGKVCAWSDGSEMGHDYRGWVMIQGAGSDGSVNCQMRHRQLGGRLRVGS